jgi:hypothetical protein
VLKKLLGRIARTFRVIASISRFIFGAVVFPTGGVAGDADQELRQDGQPGVVAGERGQLARCRCVPRELPPTW